MSAERVSGSCHCGAVAFVAELELGAPTIRCNCAICTKYRAWIAPVPAACFRLSRGEEVLTKYRFGPEAITHCFCARCGVKTHGQVRGGAEDVVAVSVGALDLAPERLAAIPIAYAGGRRDAQDKVPEVTSHL